MTPETRTRIARLPDDAPATAVIAAWAGYDVTPPGTEGSRIWLWWSPDDQFIPTHMPRPDDPQGERTLRRWLLDGRLLLDEFKADPNLYCYVIKKRTPDNSRQIYPPEYEGYGDSPEGAFAAAIEAFAATLREQASD